MSKKIITVLIASLVAVFAAFGSTTANAMSINFDLLGENEVKVGETITLSAEAWTGNDIYIPGEPNGGIGEVTRNRVNSESKWESSNEAVATVDENGVVTGISEGTVTISAEYLNYGRLDTATIDITVIPADNPEPVQPSQTSTPDQPSQTSTPDQPSEISTPNQTYEISVPDQPSQTPAPNPAQEKPVNTGSDSSLGFMLTVFAVSAALAITAARKSSKNNS